jgi:hypothetical protein
LSETIVAEVERVKGAGINHVGFGGKILNVLQASLLIEQRRECDAIEREAKGDGTQDSGLGDLVRDQHRTGERNLIDARRPEQGVEGQQVADAALLGAAEICSLERGSTRCNARMRPNCEKDFVVAATHTVGRDSGRQSQSNQADIRSIGLDQALLPGEIGGRRERNRGLC